MQTTLCLLLPRKRSPDGATTDCGRKHLIAAYYSSIDPEKMKGWVDLVGAGLRRTVYPHKWSPASYKSSAGRKVCRSPTIGLATY